MEEEVRVIAGKVDTASQRANEGDATHRTDPRSCFLGHPGKLFFSTVHEGAREPVKARAL